MKYLDKDLSEFELNKNRFVNCQGSYDYGDEELTCSIWNYIYNDNERYYFYLDYIPADDKNPENVGIQSFVLYSPLATINAVAACPPTGINCPATIATIPRP